MSSADELELYGESPLVLKNTARTTRATQRPVAGPSQPKPASGGGPAVTRRKNAPATLNRNEEEVEDTNDEVDELEGPIDVGSDSEPSVQVVAAKREKGKRPAAKIVNGRAPPVDKGKNKAEPHPKTSRKTGGRIQPIDEDIVMIEQDDHGYEARPSRSANGGAQKRQKTTGPRLNEGDATQQQLERVQQQLNDAVAHRDALSNQLEQLFKVRQTEPEELLEQQKAQYEARIKTQELLIQEMTTQLARVEPLSRSGLTSSLHFLTREAADEEKRGIEQDVQRWKEVVKEKERTVNEKDRRIAELEQLERDLRLELNAEIERSKTLAGPKGMYREPASSASKGRPIHHGKKPETAEGRVIRFYEDMTNLLVPNHVIEKSSVKELPDEYLFVCIYTNTDTSSALNFSLRVFSELTGEEGEVVEKVKYTPHDLDKETEEFQDKLGFLNEPFTFERTQLHVFFKTLGDNMGAAPQEETSDDEDVEAVLS